MPVVRLALAQTNPTVGAIAGNMANVLETIEEAARRGADIVVFGEMAVTGYPIEDLATRESFILDSELAVRELAQDLVKKNLGHILVVIGHPSMASAQDQTGWAIAHNSATVLRDGKVLGKYNKHHLPNYSVFDEYRTFVSGDELLTFEHKGLKFSTVICEDIWQSGGPVSKLSQAHTDVVLIINGSPFEIDKDDTRLKLVSDLAKKHNCAAAYVNLVGGQDDLVFDGDSIMVDSKARMIARLKQFKTDLVCIDIEAKDDIKVVDEHHLTKPNDSWQTWNALVLGLRDYVHKNNFKSVVLGLSGGIDSAIVATIAADAIGAENVYGVSMPSNFSSEHSKDDAEDLASRRGINYQVQPIANLVAPFESQLALEGLSVENLQARVRGVILMALSNKFGHLTLTTGNKTELAVGYSTIYGDTVGGYNPLKDVEKTLVWELARWRNEYAKSKGEIEPIPQNSIDKAPSAELRPNQVDQDSLPPYDVLDAILDAYVNRRKSSGEIVRYGFDEDLVNKVLTLVDRSEWKRRQSAIGPKITGMAFGRDRRLPITNKYKG
jgi:NAD+ synthase (glutamine-hydrolysing)